MKKHIPQSFAKKKESKIFGEEDIRFVVRRKQNIIHVPHSRLLDDHPAAEELPFFVGFRVGRLLRAIGFH
jgi:hypothetical protein